MRKIITIDCETDPFLYLRQPRPYLWAAYSLDDGFLTFKTAKALIEYLAPQKAVVYAHNGGKFDFLFLLEFLNENDKIKIINGRLSQFKIGNAEFRDSFLILPVALKGYKKDTIDYSIMEKGERDKPHNMKKILKYLYGDVVYLHEYVSAFVETYGPKLTLAGAAIDQVKKIVAVDIPKGTRGFFSTYKQFYFGGRVECLANGVINETLEVYDINSAYPYAMIHDHATGENVFIGDYLPALDVDIQKSFIELTAVSTGAFPVASKNGVDFPDDGEIRNFKITGWEYIAARDLGMLKRPKIKSVHYFAKTINFKPYVDHFFKIKQDAPDGSAARQMAKLLLNSAYGRYGIDGSKFLEYIVVAPDKIDETHATTKYRYLCRASNWALMAREVDETRQTYHNVATAASVTGFVRAYLLRAYKKSSGVAYMDTDSLVCKNFVGKVGVDLGQWKHEFTATRSAFYAKKGYALTNGKKEKLASKGARLTRAEIFKLARGEQVEYFQAAPTMGIKTGVKFISRKINNTNVKKAAQ